MASRYLKYLPLAVVLASVMAFAVACGDDEKETTAAAPAPAATTAPAVVEATVAPAEEKAPVDKFAGQTLNILVWVDHAGDEVLGPFKEKYPGVTLNIKEYQVTSNAFAAIKEQPEGFWDVIVMDTVATAGFVENDFLEELAPASFDMSSFFEIFKQDPNVRVNGKMYAIPDKFGYHGIAYNKDLVPDEDLESYAILWDPKYEGKIGWLNWPLIEVQMASMYLGYAPGVITDEQMEQVKVVLQKVKDNGVKVRANSGDLQPALANGSIAMVGAGAAWMTGNLAADGLPVDWVIPKEGGLIWVESVGIGKGTKNKELAEELVKYYISPEGQARLATSVPYWAMPTNSAASGYLTAKQQELLRWEQQVDFQSSSQLYVQVASEVEEEWNLIVESIMTD